jgi:hypothetical protein
MRGSFESDAKSAVLHFPELEKIRNEPKAARDERPLFTETKDLARKDRSS